MEDQGLDEAMNEDLGLHYYYLTRRVGFEGYWKFDDGKKPVYLEHTSEAFSFVVEIASVILLVQKSVLDEVNMSVYPCESVGSPSNLSSTPSKTSFSLPLESNRSNQIVQRFGDELEKFFAT